MQVSAGQISESVVQRRIGSLPIFERTLVWTQILIVTGYPLVAAIPIVLNAEPRAFTVPFRAVVLILSLGHLLANFIFRRGHTKPSLWWAVFAVYWVVFLIRMLEETAFTKTLVGFEPEDYWLIGVGVTLVPTLAMSLRLSDRALNRERYLLQLFTLLGAVATYFVGIQFGHHEELGRFSTETVNPITFGSLGLFIILISISQFYSQDTSVSHGARMPLWMRAAVVSVSAAIPFFGLYVIILSGSRGPFVGAIAGVVFLLAFKKSSNFAQKVQYFVLIGGLAIAGVFLAALVSETGGFFLERLFSGPLGEGYEDLSDQERTAMWAEAWNQFVDSPLTGSSIEVRGFGFYPHNMLLESLIAGGFIEGALFLALLVFGLRCSIRVIRFASQHSWIALMYIAQACFAFYTGCVWASPLFWYFWALSLAVGNPRSSSVNQRLKRN